MGVNPATQPDKGRPTAESDDKLTYLNFPFDMDDLNNVLAAEKRWLPQFAGKTIKPTPTIVNPKDVKRATAPIDPMLAIYARFGALA
jgi:hypothetical protein